MATTAAPTLENWRENKITGKKITQSESTKQPINITGDISHVPWKEAKVLIFRQRREDLQELIPDNLEFLLGSCIFSAGFHTIATVIAIRAVVNSNRYTAKDDQSTYDVHIQ